jgi:hypothetical protein
VPPLHQRLEGYTLRVRSCAPSGRIKSTKDKDLDDPPILKPMKECPTPPEAQGLLSRINIIVPKGEGLINVNINPTDG